MTTTPLGLPADLGPDTANDYVLDRLEKIDEITLEIRRAAWGRGEAQQAVDIETEVARIRAALQYL